MAARFSWKGYLRLSLVSCPVQLAPATTSRERISFHLLNPKTNNRIVTRTVDPETGEEIPRSELVRGYEFEKGRYVEVGPEELERLEIESSKTIDLVRFVDRDAVDPVYFNAPYYLAPEGKIGDETFRVIRDAMADTRKAGIGQVVLSLREHPVLVEPKDAGMVLFTLRSADEVRDAREYFDGIGTSKLDREMIALAKKLIEQKSGPFDPKELTGDRYQEALRDLVAQKIKGGKPVTPKMPAAPSNVVNLMDALRRSLAGAEGKAPARRSRKEQAEPAHAGKKPARVRTRRAS